MKTEAGISPTPQGFVESARVSPSDFLEQASKALDVRRPNSLEAQSFEAMATPFQRIRAIFETLPQLEPMWEGDNRHGVQLSNGRITVTDHTPLSHREGDAEHEFIVNIESPSLEDPDPNMPTRGYGSFRVSETGVTQITLPNNTNINIDGLDTAGVYDHPTSMIYPHKTVLGRGSRLRIDPNTDFGKAKGEEMIAWAEQIVDTNALVQFPEMTIALSSPVPQETA